MSESKSLPAVRVLAVLALTALLSLRGLITGVAKVIGEALK